jgi:hypothetical protein
MLMADLMADARYCHLADIVAEARPRPLLGVKRTSLFRALMSANDPRQTSRLSTTVPQLTDGGHVKRATLINTVVIIPVSSADRVRQR